MKKPGSSPKNKMYFLFGEHARELISPESGIYFLKSLCGETETSDYLQGVLDDTEFRVVLNGNPHSRRKARSTRNLVCNGVGFWFGSRYSGSARS